MKSSSNLLEGLKGMPHVSKDSVQKMGMRLGLGDATIDTYISRFLKRRQLHKLKKGVYVAADFLEAHRQDTAFLFYLSNVLRQPSYVSSWTALQYYDLTTEAIHPITSVTTKVTRAYQTKTGTFAYQSINGELFTNFFLVKGTFDFFLASPSKALFDLLYFRTHQFRGMSKEKVTALIEELRIEFNEMDTEEQKKFFELLSPYVHE